MTASPVDTFTITPEMYDAVAEWREQPHAQQIALPLVPFLRQRFSLNYEQALSVQLEANLRCWRAM